MSQTIQFRSCVRRQQFFGDRRCCAGLVERWRNASLLAGWIVWLLSLGSSFAAETPLLILYSLNNQETIEVRRGLLHWLPSGGELSRAEARTAVLSATNVAWLHRWLDTHRVLSLAADYPTTNARPEIGGGTLAIRVGAQQRLITWEQGCDCGGLLTAMEDLKSFASSVATNAAVPKSMPATAALREVLQPAKKVPFKQVVQITTKHRVLDFDPRNPQHVKLRDTIRAAAVAAGKQALVNGVFATRANEAGNHIEPFVKRALRELKLDARTPVNASGDAQITGYPDLEIPGPVPCYLELKTYNAATANTTQRTFYYSPSSHPKITRDALHLLLAFEMKKSERASKTVFAPVHWKLITLQDLAVDLKFEFNQSNRGLYGSDAAGAVMAEGTVTE